jgi:low affinity Fe/Cu permease
MSGYGHRSADRSLSNSSGDEHTKPEHSNGSFHTFAGRASVVVGSKWAFTTAVLLIVIWGISGPYFHFSDTWQLVVNTATTIVTFLIVFLIQNTQNRDARAIHLKLDEIIHAIKGARNEMIQIENLSDSDLDVISKNFERIRAECERRSSRSTASASK